jgi:phosphinothricin acetyltransferase
VIRDATSSDAAACAAIYEPYVRGTAITFETEAPDAAAFAERIAAAQVRHAWLVAEQDGEVVGYAYAGPIRARAAYAWSVETTVYLRQGLRRSGTGRALMEALLTRLSGLGMRRAFAGVALPNEASIGLHHALGFRDAGVWERVGFKLDAWWDVAWLQRDLG